MIRDIPLCSLPRLQDGLTTTGVSVLYSVKEMDAGPVLAQQSFQVGVARSDGGGGSVEGVWHAGMRAPGG